MPTAHQSSILDQRICFSVIRMPLSRWPAFAGWYQIIQWNSEINDEKQQNKNQRVSIHQTRFILCSLLYCRILQHTTHASSSNLPLCKNKGRQYYTVETAIKFKLYSVRRVRTFSWSNLRLYLCTILVQLSIQIAYSFIFHPCFFARIAFSTPAFSVAPLSPVRLFACHTGRSVNKKAVLPQGNRAMPQVFFSVEVRQH